MDWATTINLGGFGNSADMEWRPVKSWKSFTEFFEDAVHIDAVTYCKSPKLLLDLFDQQNSKLETMALLKSHSSDMFSFETPGR